MATIENNIKRKRVKSKRIHWLHKYKCAKGCEKCGWNEWNKFTNKVPLQVNHIDGNALHHRPENLELICPKILEGIRKLKEWSINKN